MELEDFEEDVDYWIVGRGRDYYNEGRVINIKEQKNNRWQAIVEGTENYNVKVSIEDGSIISSECDCPYDMGPVCKHEVAVYYAIRDKIPGEIRETERETAEERIKKLVDKLSKEELAAIISEKALYDDKFYNRLIAQYELPEMPENKSYYKKIVRSSLNAVKRGDFISYRDAYDAAAGAFELISGAKAAFQKNEYEKAIAMSQAVIEEMVPSLGYTDDSGGDAGTAISEAFDILDECTAADLPEKIRKSLLKYCLNEPDKDVYESYGEFCYLFLDMAENLSATDDEVNLFIGRLEKRIKEIPDKDFFSSYRAERLSGIKYGLLLRTKRWEEAERFLNDNVGLPAFRRKALEHAYKLNDYERAIELALDGEKKDGAKNYYGLVREWKEWRFRIYTSRGDIKKIQELALELLVEGKEIKYYDAYKQTISGDEWEKVYEQLKLSLKEKYGTCFPALLADILVKEKEFPELLDILKKYPSYVGSYEKHFLKSHPGVIYSLHAENIRKEAKYANERRRYRDVCAGIKTLKKIGGSKEAGQIVEELRKVYKNRPAFQDELSKLQ